MDINYILKNSSYLYVCILDSNDNFKVYRTNEINLNYRNVAVLFDDEKYNLYIIHPTKNGNEIIKYETNFRSNIRMTMLKYIVNKYKITDYEKIQYNYIKLMNII